MKTYKSYVELEINRSVRIRKIVLFEDYKKSVLEFKKKLDELDKRNNGFNYDLEILLKEFDKIFGRFD
ncbi:MAG: hypothetical protein ACTSRG_22700 [Candidatus Helarchaeota archaeon]